MKVFNHISFNFDFNEFSEKIHLSSYRDRAEAVEALLAAALPLIKPKAVLEVSYVQGRSENSVDIGSVSFESRVLSANLKEVGRVFPYIATCGNELGNLDLFPEDLLTQYWLDTFKEMALRAAAAYLQDHIKQTYGLKQISVMHPGAGDQHLWPIEQQKKLFSLFSDAEALIGVKLTDSCLMIPNKSLSGIYFPTTVEFTSCQLCTRRNCPHRRAPYTGRPDLEH